jgi:hypothetical protein
VATTEERMKILKMVEEGRINAQEGAKLLAALSNSERRRTSSTTAAGQAKWFRVRVAELNSGRNKVNVSLPMSLVNVGIKMGARLAPDVEGLDFDEIMEAIRSGAQGKIVDVVDKEGDERIEIFIE